MNFFGHWFQSPCRLFFHTHDQLLYREYDTFSPESPTYRTRQPTFAQLGWAEPYPAKQLLYHRIAVLLATIGYPYACPFAPEHDQCQIFRIDLTSDESSLLLVSPQMSSRKHCMIRSALGKDPQYQVKASPFGVPPGAASRGTNQKQQHPNNLLQPLSSRAQRPFAVFSLLRFRSHVLDLSLTILPNHNLCYDTPCNLTRHRFHISGRQSRPRYITPVHACWHTHENNPVLR